MVGLRIILEMGRGEDWYHLRFVDHSGWNLVVRDLEGLMVEDYERVVKYQSSTLRE